MWTFSSSQLYSTGPSAASIRCSYLALGLYSIQLGIPISAPTIGYCEQCWDPKASRGELIWTCGCGVGMGRDLADL